MTIKQIDTARLPVVDHGAARMERPSRAAYSATHSAIDEADEGETEEPLDETVDLLVVYTPAAESHEGGRAEIEATIAAEVEKTSQALANSALNHREIRLIAVERLDYTQSKNFLGDDLSYLGARKGDNTGDDPDGVLDEVHELRERSGADLVHLFSGDRVGACGIAKIYTLDTQRFAEFWCQYNPSPDACIAERSMEEWRYNTFSTSAIPEGCTIQDVFAHELGHNFDIYHDRYSSTTLSLTDPVLFPLKPYAFGYVNQNFSRSECRFTIMASGKQCSDEGYESGTGIKELMFSNPDLNLGNEEVGFDPAGVEGEEWTVELDGPVNASRAIDDVWDIVANLYSPTESGHAVPFMPAAGDCKVSCVS